MLLFVIGLLIVPALLSAEQLFSFDDSIVDRDASLCKQPNLLSCKKINLNLEALFQSENLELPHGMTLTRSRMNPIEHEDYTSFSFKNEDEFLDAIFVYNSELEHPFLTGSVTWGKQGRHFQIDQCYPPFGECSLWSEVDPKFWANMESDAGDDAIALPDNASADITGAFQHSFKELRQITTTKSTTTTTKPTTTTTKPTTTTTKPTTTTTKPTTTTTKPTTTITKPTTTTTKQITTTTKPTTTTTKPTTTTTKPTSTITTITTTTKPTTTSITITTSTTTIITTTTRTTTTATTTTSSTTTTTMAPTTTTATTTTTTASIATTSSSLPMAQVSITIYTTVEFRSSFSNSQSAMADFINLAISETNSGYQNSGVPIQLFLKCIVSSSVNDNPSFSQMITDFYYSANGDFNAKRVSADIALLLTNSGDSCGIAYFDTIAAKINLGVVQKSCATGYYSFGHEIAHMYGAHHNKETGATNPTYPNAFGYLMRPPVNSDKRTIMAYNAAGYATRINYYSNPSISAGGIPTGTATDNNSEILTARRFLMAAVGDESLACPDTASG